MSPDELHCAFMAFVPLLIYLLRLSQLNCHDFSRLSNKTLRNELW